MAVISVKRQRAQRGDAACLRFRSERFDRHFEPRGIRFDHTDGYCGDGRIARFQLVRRTDPASDKRRDIDVLGKRGGIPRTA